MTPRLLPASALLSCALLVGCDRPPAHPEGKVAEQAAGKVQTVAPERKALKRLIEQPGTIQADAETPLYAKLAGFVHKIHKDIGDNVKGPKYDKDGKETRPGDVLATIDNPELVEESKQKDALVEQAKVEVEQAQKNALTAEAAVTAAQAQVKVAEAAKTRALANYKRWQSESQRVARLVAEKVLDSQVADETHNQYKAAEAARDETLAQVTSADAAMRKVEAERDRAAVDVRLAAARQKVAEAEARRLRELLRYTTIRAPFDGVVSQRSVVAGHFVQPAGSDKAAPLYTVVRLDPVRIVVNVPEADAGLVTKDLPARVAVQVLGGREFTGKVSRTSWALEQGSRTLRTEIDLPNKEGQLRPGMYTYARITAELPPAWVLPAGAVVKQGDQMVCFRVENGKAIRTPVRVGHGDGESVQVLFWQKAGEPSRWEEWTGKEVIARKARGLTDGQAVEVATP
jgi:RND family efflux transporter MFP subunit